MILYKIQDLLLNNPAKRDRLIIINLVFSLLINVVLWLTLILNFWQSSEYIVLRYNIYFGISSFGPWQNIFIIPILGLIFIIINLFFSFYFYLKMQILSYFFVLTSSLFNIVLLVVVFLLSYINL